MARASYGQQVKVRSRLLLEALLTYANDELDCNEADLEALRQGIQIRWLSEKQLVVRTKVRFLAVLTGMIGDKKPLNAEQIKESLKRFADFIEILQDNRPTRGGSETWHFTLNLWYKRQDSAANLKQFDCEWESRRTVDNQKLQTPPKPSEPSQPSLINWQEICRHTLEAQNHRRLTTNPLTSGDGVTFELDQVYVPLGLIERRHRERHRDDVAPYEGSRLYEPDDTEGSQTFVTDEFLEQVLRQRQSKRIAIVGEPGAGKTTLLQKIAAWLLDNTSDLPVWISLADLQGKTLDNYLLQDWLKIATRKPRISPEIEEDFCTQFNQGRVWLLLDAVDEMAMESTSALAKLANFLQGWVADANIILTCRLNVWDAGKNCLEYFDTFRNQNFSYSSQVGQFIRHWFQENPEMGERLGTELEQGGRGRIKDAVKNPLRLALLCRTWGLRQGNFPDTKITLYEQFVEAIYEWKQDRFPTTSAQRRQLNQALGKLAVLAITQEKTKFRLRHRFVCEVLGEPDEGLFQLALQVGWLNQVGISKNQQEKVGEKVYAFYHPTFQEYFAAQAVPDWRYFFQPNSEEPTQGIYHIFEPQWREVILLWFGRDDIDQSQKEEFITALINFQDKCGGYYQYQAYFLAAQGIAEVGDCQKADEIIRQLIKWRFGYFHPHKQNWWHYPGPIIEGARVALLKTERTKAIAALEEFIQTNDDNFNLWNVAYSLGKTFAPGNLIAITTLEKIVQTVRNETIRWQAALNLGKIDPGNKVAIAGLIQIITSTKSEATRRKAAYSLGKIDPENNLAISTLEKIATTSDASMQRIASDNLAVLRGITTPKKSPAQEKPAYIYRRKNKLNNSSFTEITSKISALLKGIELASDDSTRRQKAYKLAKIDPGNTVAFSHLLEILKTAKTEAISKRTADNLKEVLQQEQLPAVVASLKNCFSHTTSETEMEKFRSCYKLLWYCASNMNYLDFYYIWHEDRR
jgi:predicted NACHT family NTPase